MTRLLQEASRIKYIKFLDGAITSILVITILWFNLDWNDAPSNIYNIKGALKENFKIEQITWKTLSKLS